MIEERIPEVLDEAPPAPEEAAVALADTWHPDARERERLVERYAHLVKYIVGRLGVAVPGVFDHDDAMQAGVIGLLQAIDGYRPEAAASFESYALLRIRGAILDAVRSIDVIGRTGREAARAIERAMSELSASLGRIPDEREVADHLGMPLGRYQERLKSASVVTISLDAPDERWGGGDAGDLADVIADDAAPDPAQLVERRDDVARLSSAIGGLGERQKMVLALYYQDELTLREIGEVLGVTESRVCQIHAETLIALRSRLGEGLTGRPGRHPNGRRRGGGDAGKRSPAFVPAQAYRAASASTPGSPTGGSTSAHAYRATTGTPRPIGHAFRPAAPRSSAPGHGGAPRGWSA